MTSASRTRRAPFPRPDELSPDHAALMAQRPPLDLFRMLPRTGALMRPFMRMGGTIRENLRLSPALREVAIVRVGVRTGAAYEVHHHRRIAQSVGVAPDTLVAIETNDAAGLSIKEELVVQYVDALVDEVRAPDPLFRELCDAIGVDEVAELTMTIGFYLMVSRFLLNFDIEPEEG